MRNKTKTIKSIALVFLSVLCVFCAAISIKTLPVKADEAAASLIENGDFEAVSGSFADGWSSWTTLNGADSSKADVRVSLAAGEEAHSGNYAIKVINNSSDSSVRAVVNNMYFQVGGGKTYLISFYYKSTSPNVIASLCLRQFRSYNSSTGVYTETAKNTYFWCDSATFTGETSGWQKLSAVITYESTAKYSRIQLDIAPGGEHPVYFDDFEMTEIDVTAVNSGFERKDGFEDMYGWLLNESGSVTLSSEVYYEGNYSAHIVRNNYAGSLTLSSVGKVDVVTARSYKTGFRMRSENSNAATALLDVTFYNSYGSIAGTFKSPYTFLKNNDGLSDWVDVMMRVTAPSGSVKMAYKITITEGVADCYIDDVFCEDVTSAVYYQDFSRVSSDGKIDGTDITAEKIQDGKLALNGNEEARLEVDSFLYGNGYTLTGKKTATDGGRAEIDVEWYNYMGEKLSVTQFESDKIADDFSLEFLAPQGTYAKIVLRNSGSGKVTFGDITVEKTYDPKYDKDGWQGYWVCFPYADIAYGGTYRYAYYRYSFELSEAVDSAQLQVTGDDQITSYVNGNELEDSGKTSWAKVLTTYVTNYLKVGKNTLAFAVYNESYYGGLLFDMDVVTVSGKKIRISSSSDVLSSESKTDGWTSSDYNDSGWRKTYEIGKPPCMPWGEIVYKKSAETLPKFSIDGAVLPESVKAGELVEFTLTVTPENDVTEDLSMRVNFRSKYVADEDEVMETWLTPKLVKGTPSSKWKGGETYVNTYTVIAPDYLEGDSYMLQFGADEMKITNSEYDGNILRGVYFRLEADDTIQLTESKIVKEGDRVNLVINGEKVAPMMYLREQTTVFKTDYATGMDGAGVELMCLPNCRIYNMNNSGSMWTGYGKYDFSALDNVVYETLQGAPTAKLMLMMDADPPQWWLNDNPSAYAKDSKGQNVGISYASEKWREDVGVFYRAMLEHVLKQPYASHIFAAKISAGTTYEWQYYGVTLNQCADFGTDALKAFRVWLKKKYGTVALLQKAWNNYSVTFETATVPTYEQRKASTYQTLLDGKAQRNVIDFHTFQCDMVTDSILYLSQIVKEACNDKWIVGTYNGYMTHGQTYEANGLANSSISRILESPFIDFLCSPICYDERLIGMSASYMMMVDSVIAAGKLPIIECDSRTVYFENNSNPALLGEWGKTYTLKDSIEALKRDFANMMIKGAGLWWYDMYGGWFHDPEIYDMFKKAKDEWDYAVKQKVEGTSRIAYVIDDDLITEMAYNFGGTYDYLRQALYMQKESLGHIGTSYDMLFLSDIKDGLDRDYDVFLIVAADVDKEERAALDKYVKKDGKTVIWVGFPGIYGDDGTMSVENVSALVGMKLGYAKNTTYGITIVGNDGYTKGLDGKVFGKIGAGRVDPVLYVKDNNVEVLGKLYGTNLIGFAARAVETSDGGYYMSIYSSVGNIPEGVLRNILSIYGVELNENENDVIFKNSLYTAIASPYGGEKTLNFAQKTDVYDVFKGEWIARGVTSVTIEAEEGQLVLLRTEKEKTSNPDPVDPGDSSKPGCGGCNGCNGSVSGSCFALAGVFAAILIARKKRG